MFGNDKNENYDSYRVACDRLFNSDSSYRRISSHSDKIERDNMSASDDGKRVTNDW